MSGETKKQDTKNDQSSTYVKTFRRGAIAANVFRRTTSGGTEYMNFSVSRAWKTKAGNEGYSQNLFANNRDAVIEVVNEACDFITANAPSVPRDDGARVDQSGSTALEARPG